MTINHATMNTAVSTLPRTEFGMPLLSDDMLSNDAWWAMRDDEIGSDERLDLVHGYRPTVVVAALDLDEPAKHPQVQDVREPDLYDDGRAVWLSSDAVVSMDISEVHRLPLVLAQDDRVAEDIKRFERQTVGNRTTWTRVHPNRYGIEVNAYFDHGDGLEPHTAQDAWDLARKAVQA